MNEEIKPKLTTDEGTTFFVRGAMVWGRGATITEAFANCEHPRYNSEFQLTMVRGLTEGDKPFVDGMGSLNYPKTSEAIDLGTVKPSGMIHMSALWEMMSDGICSLRGRRVIGDRKADNLLEFFESEWDYDEKSGVEMDKSLLAQIIRVKIDPAYATS